TTRPLIPAIKPCIPRQRIANSSKNQQTGSSISPLFLTWSSTESLGNQGTLDTVCLLLFYDGQVRNLPHRRGLPLSQGDDMPPGRYPLKVGLRVTACWLWSRLFAAAVCGPIFPSIIAGLALWLANPILAIPSESNPNIVFILCDDLGYGDLRCLNPQG